MPQLKEIEHTADRAFLVRGKDLNELFTQAAQALLQFEGRKPYGKGSLSREAEVEVEGFDRETLLVNWLNEILYLQEAREETYTGAEILEISDQHLKARLKGQPGDRRMRLIKSVTFNGLRIKETTKGIEATVIVDV